MAFRATTLTGTASGTGVFTGLPGQVAAAARTGDSAPAAGGGTSGTYTTIFSPAVNTTGQVAFFAGTTTGNGVFAGVPGQVAAAARTGDLAPATGGGMNGYYTAFGAPAVNNAGQVAFRATTLTSAGSGDGLFAGTPGQVAAAARTGDAAPAVGGGTNGTYANFSTGLAVNAVGQVAFRADIQLASTGGSGVFAGLPGQVVAAARTGDAAPAVGGGTSGTYANFSVPAVNNAGQVAFRADTLTGTANGSGLFAGMPGQVGAVARTGDAAPAVGGGTNGTYHSIDANQTAINAAGQVGFNAATIAGGEYGRGLFVGTTVATKAIARTGSNAIGGSVFSDIGFLAPALNSSGQAAFVASVSGPGIDSTNDRRLFAWDPTTGLSLIVRTGQQVDVNPSAGVEDWRTIESISFAPAAGTESGLVTGFSDSGLISYTLTFTTESGGGSGVFISQFTPVPEPATCGLMAAVVLVASRRVRRWTA